MVDSATLQPVRSTRTFGDSAKGTRTFVSAVYDGATARLHREDPGQTHDTTRDLPQPSAKNADPGVYDDGSLYWLVRGIPLRTGFKAAYSNVTTQVVTVTVRVAGQERIHVPAGDFNTWKVIFETSSSAETAWVDDSAPHRFPLTRHADETVFRKSV